MKKRLLVMLVLMLLVPHGVFADGKIEFGALSWETENGLVFFSDGGSGFADSVGFELSNGKNTIVLPQIGAGITDNICLKITGLKDGDYTLCRFAADGGGYVRSEQVYITAADGKYSVCGKDEKNLFDAKKTAKSELNGYIADRTLYREKESAEIDAVLEKYAALIDACASENEVWNAYAGAKAELDGVPKKEWFDKNAEANREVLSYLEDANLWLCGKAPYDDIRFLAKEKQIVNIIKPVISAVITGGREGEFVISNEYIRAAYASEIAETKKIYKEDMSDTERSWFNEKVAALNTETADFLKEFFA